MSDRLPGGERLRAWREAAGKSQKECAEAIGVRQPTWSEWEAGTRTPSVTHSFAIEAFSGGKVKAKVFAKQKPEAA